VTRQGEGHIQPQQVEFDYAALRAKFHGGWIVNNGYDKALATQKIQSGYADAVAFGMPIIANPDLVRRLREDAPLNEVDTSTLYGGGVAGYTDYPTLDEVVETA